MALAIDSNILWVMLGGDGHLQQRIDDYGDVVVPIPVLGEARFAVRNSGRPALNEARLESFLRDAIIPPLTPETARLYAEIRYALKFKWRPIPMNDVWIAAVCLEHALRLVSRDADFDHVDGLRVLRW